VGPESSDSGLFREEEIPWDEIAFPVIHQTLKEYFADVVTDQFPVRVSTIERRRPRE
jgi:hypothetical protein